MTHRLSSPDFCETFDVGACEKRHWPSSPNSRRPLASPSRSCVCATPEEKEPTRQPSTGRVASKWLPQITLTSGGLEARRQTRRIMNSRSLNRCRITESLLFAAGVPQLMHSIVTCENKDRGVRVVICNSTCFGPSTLGMFIRIVVGFVIVFESLKRRFLNGFLKSSVFTT